MASTQPTESEALPVHTPRAIPAPRLAKSQMQRMRRIVDQAVRLAEQGGFEAVRLRDVAEASGVALGTLYKYFRSKEDILLFALTEQVERLEEAMQARPVAGESEVERIATCFRRATNALVRRPDFARAVVRSVATGGPEHTAKVASFHLRMTRLILSAMKGQAPEVGSPAPADIGTERERQLASALQHVWFASLVGWANGLHAARVVVEQVEIAASLMLPVSPTP